MYNNFHRLSKTSLSIVMAIISVILMVVFLILGFNYEGKVLAGFILFSLGFLCSAGGSIIKFVKCRKFGNKNADKINPPNQLQDKNTFKNFNNIMAILTIISVLFWVIGLILMIA